MFHVKSSELNIFQASKCVLKVRSLLRRDSKWKSLKSALQNRFRDRSQHSLAWSSIYWIWNCVIDAVSAMYRVSSVHPLTDLNRISLVLFAPYFLLTFCWCDHFNCWFFVLIVRCCLKRWLGFVMSRGKAISVAVVANFGWNLLVTLFFPTELDLIGSSWTFAIFAVIDAYSLYFIHTRVRSRSTLDSSCLSKDNLGGVGKLYKELPFCGRGGMLNDRSSTYRWRSLYEKIDIGFWNSWVLGGGGG